MLKTSLVILLVVCGFLAMCDDKDAMQRCEKHSSRDECFYALNR